MRGVQPQLCTLLSLTGPEDVAIAFQVEQQLAEERHSAQLARMQQELHHAELRRLEESLSRLSEGPAGKSSAGVLNLIKELMQNPVVGEAATWVTTANIEPTQPDERAACEALRAGESGRRVFSEGRESQLQAALRDVLASWLPDEGDRGPKESREAKRGYTKEGV